MAVARKTITPETLVNMTLKGEQHTFALAAAQEGSVEAWANTISDLSGYKPEFIVGEIIKGLTRNYGVELPTAAGDLCPIRFLVTRAQ